MNHASTNKQNAATHSYAPTASPTAAPDPANPIKCSLDIFAANIDKPIWCHFELRLAKKYCEVSFPFLEK